MDDCHVFVTEVKEALDLPRKTSSSVYNATSSRSYLYWSLYSILAPGIRFRVQVFYTINNMTRRFDIQEAIYILHEIETDVG